ncbi:MAG: hypothetical protein R3C04_02870 [Hyphomonas sp.]
MSLPTEVDHITGSIGIFGGKFALEGAFNKIGITFDDVTVAATLPTPTASTSSPSPGSRSAGVPEARL